jgi:hypothetical protein
VTVPSGPKGGNGKRAPRQRIQPYLSRALVQRFGAHCAAIGATESAVAEAAIAQYLDGTSDHTVLMRRMDRLSRSATRTQRDLDVLAEAFGVFVQVWFAHTPNIPDDNKDAARRESARRYQQFVDHVATRLGHGRQFLQELAKDLADVEELDAVRNSAPQGPGEEPT